MEDQENKADGSPLRRLDDVLYARDGKRILSPQGRTPFSHTVPETSPDWGHEHRVPLPPVLPEERYRRTVRRLFLFSILFFFVAAGIAVYMVIGNHNSVSTANVEIAATGPTTIAGGDVLSVQIDVTNNNAATLEVADLLVTFPQGTRNPDDLTKEMPRLRKNLGNLKPGATASYVVDAVLFGEEHSTQTLIVSVEYRIPGSNAIFHKERTYDVTISTAPLSLAITAPERLNTGQTIVMTLDLSSNATGPIENVLLAAEYPFGFSFKKATPPPTYGQNVWKIGDLDPNGKRTIRIEGTLSGQDGENRIFRFASGIASEKDAQKIEAPFVTIVRSLLIDRPFLALSARLNGEQAEEYIAKSGENIRLNIGWRNNLPVPITDGVLEVALGGTAFDERLVSVQNGFYRSTDNVVIWDARSIPALGSIEAGGSGDVSVSFASFSSAQLAQLLTNASIPLSIRFHGTSRSTTGAPDAIAVELPRTVIIATNLQLNVRTVHSGGPFQNTGPIPPRANQETTYTVTWAITNATNDVSRAMVRAILPSYVRFTGATMPSGAITFNQATGEVLWNAGEIPAGLGYTTAAREASFQVAILPSVSQVGTSPTLVGQEMLEGTDRFARISVSDTEDVQTTRITADSTYKEGDDKVKP